MARFMIPKKVLVALALFAGLLFGGGGASAQCVEGNPEMKCPVAVCIALDQIVFDNCKGPNTPTSCSDINGCEALLAMRAKWQGCLAARLDMKATCFPAPNAGHDIQIALVEKSVRICDKKIARRRPVGCGDPCP